jgi:DNA (cytosine-5)-methyltransferase 1
MLPAQLGTGGNNQPFVVKSTVYESHPMDSRIKELDETAPTVSVKWHKGAADTPLVCEKHPIYCLQGNGIDRADNAGCNGAGWREGQSYTLNTIDRPAVAYSLETFHCVSEEELTTTLKARDYKDPVCVAYGVDCRNLSESEELYPTIQAKPNGGQSLNYSGAVRIQYIVRRLTPTECARLQGFPDRWATPDQKDDLTDEEYEFWLNVRNTHAEINGKATKEYTKAQMTIWYNKLHTDSAEYKLWGNGIALPTALYVMQGIAEVFK